MKTASDYNFHQKKVLVRVDFNVPLNNRQEVVNDMRIRASLPTIRKIINDGGSAILIAHLGRPKGQRQNKYSLQHVVPKVAKLLGQAVQFAEDCIGPEAEKKVKNLKSGQVLLLENVRFHAEEKKGDTGFAKQLARYAEVYVNDAFGAAHRAHVSTTVVAQFFPDDKKMPGLLMKDEIEHAQRLLQSDEKPFTAIIGGAKVSDKIGLLERLMEPVDHIIIGGGMAYTFFKAMAGQTGRSIVENDKLDTAKKLLEKASEQSARIHLPQDSIMADDFSNKANTGTASSKAIPKGYMGLDIGPEAIQTFREVIHASKKILWNGPMGVFEMSNFAKGTQKVGEAVAQATEKGAYSLAGGGDTLAALTQFGLEDKMTFISTGGGALLTFIEGEQLPGIEAVTKKARSKI